MTTWTTSLRNDNRIIATGAGLSMLAHLAFIGLIIAISREPTAPLLSTEDNVSVDVETITENSQIKEAPKPSIEAAPRETVLERTETPKVVARQPTDASGVPDPLVGSAKSGDGLLLNRQKLADLIDKSIKEEDKRPKKFDKLAQKLEKDLPQQALLSPVEAATLVQAMRDKITQCFSMPAGAEDLSKMQVTVHIRLSPEGRLDGPPQVIARTGQTAANTAFFRAFTDATLRATLRCQPYLLPADKYEYWREQDIIFNPKDLVR